jgi:hypothetical protein
MPVKCPKCRGLRLKLHQHGDLIDTYLQNAKGVISSDPTEPGRDWSPLFVVAECLNPDCRYEWTLKKSGFVKSLAGFGYEKENVVNPYEVKKWMEGE